MSGNRLIIFTMEGCGACKYLKKKLKESNIQFLDLDIDEYPDLWNKVVQQTGIDYVPTAYIVKENEDEGVVFSPTKDYVDAEDLINKISIIL